MAEEPKPEEQKKEPIPAVVVKDGKITVNEDWYNGLTTDMKKYKEERNELRLKVEKQEKAIEAMKAKDKEVEEKKLLEDEKYKELVDIKSQELIDMQVKFDEQAIDTELKTKALQAGLNKIDFVKLIDKSKIKIDTDTKAIKGIDETLTNFKEKNSELFRAEKVPKTEDGKPGGIGQTITFDDLMKNSELAMKLKKENPDVYQSIKKAAGR